MLLSRSSRHATDASGVRARRMSLVVPGRALQNQLALKNQSALGASSFAGAGRAISFRASALRSQHDPGDANERVPRHTRDAASLNFNLRLIFEEELPFLRELAEARR